MNKNSKSWKEYAVLGGIGIFAFLIWKYNFKSESSQTGTDFINSQYTPNPPIQNIYGTNTPIPTQQDYLLSPAKKTIIENVKDFLTNPEKVIDPTSAAKIITIPSNLPNINTPSIPSASVSNPIRAYSSNNDMLYKNISSNNSLGFGMQNNTNAATNKVIYGTSNPIPNQSQYQQSQANAPHVINALNQMLSNPFGF